MDLAGFGAWRSLRRHTTVAIDDTFPAGEPGIALWPANHEPPRGIHEHILVAHFETGLAHDRPDDVCQDPGAQLRVVDHVGVLRRNHDLIDPDRLRALV